MDLRAMFEKEKLDQQLKYEKELAEKDNQIDILTEMNLRFSSKIREQEQIIRINADIADQLAS